MVNLVLTYALAGVSAVLLLWGFLVRVRRYILWLGAILAAGAAVAAHNDAFWPLVCLTVLMLWTVFAVLPIVDMNWRMRFSLVMTVTGVAFLAFWPSLSRMTGGYLPCPSYIQDRVEARLVAGLDLRGGLRLVYTVDVDEAIKDRRDRYYEDMRVELAKIYDLYDADETERPGEEVYEKLRKKVDLSAPKAEANAISIRVKDGTDPTKIDARFLQRFSADLSYARSVDKRVIDFTMRESVESQIRERAVGQAREIILRRVDELGLREAAVSTRDEDIIVEVPGEDESSFSRIRDIISQTARLEFKLLDDDSDFFAKLGEQVSKNPQSAPEDIEFRRENTTVGLDEEGAEVPKTVTYAYLPIRKDETSRETLKRLKEWVATLDVPPDREVGYELEYRTVDETTLKQEEAGFRTYLLKSRAEITGDLIRDAQAAPAQGQNTLGGWHVLLAFTDQGGSLFSRITEANVKRRFAIILDGRTESAPVIQTKIAGGHAQITLGSADPEVQLRDAKKLELVLRSGALPAPISPSNEQRIGPSLGRDSIRLGVEGALGGALLVLLFMVVYYRRAGLIANISVGMNLFLQLAVLASFGASMTLPGIAGLALTLGMSVDANVLINERIREELREGRSPRAAVELGYSKALSAIIDGQLTTLISGVVLAQYGTGPIKGFAVTLIVGVLCATFSGVVISRVMFDLWVRRMGKKAVLDMG